MSEEAKPAPVIGEIVKAVRVTGLTVAQSADGQWLCIKFPFDMDGHQLIFQINHEEVDELVRTVKVTADEMAGVRARRRAEKT